MKKFTIASVLGLLLFSGMSINAWAETAMSWNLAKDVIFAKERVSPSSPWAFMENTSGVNNPDNYVLLPSFTADVCGGKPATCWQDVPSGAHVTVHKETYNYSGNGSFTVPAGNVIFHPGMNSQTIIRWTSPITGTVNILGRINSIHTACGDGVAWSLNQGNTVLQSGSLAKGTGAVFSLGDVPVTVASTLYFVLDKKTNYSCDSSTIDMLITN
ncbi:MULTISPECIES: hypothetical protein [unclassified Pseudomonas]|uniref:hypothetical protein n=1 Tax=unclassified Pseudomonas TaxID=196821 RepID=UPI00119F73D0|nr:MULTISPECIES: hypothetical protein [unclassified Pseudomonas]TWC06449.1 hypothetical protein FBY00_16613 [Pseudomonas sp. SJZ075]TWC25360.1 hypothetical protein FBY02_1641 [Pseudomonas sp. SJZ078]TWC44270.1 hypothetical protein FBY11_1671 [Pseudomonas sp. SJZ124]TWC79529.1 hypothetical protein FBY09_16613 [Pseudomonas sp. SJZ101]